VRVCVCTCVYECVNLCICAEAAKNYHAYAWVVWTSYVTHVNDSRHTREGVMSHKWRIHVSQYKKWSLLIRTSHVRIVAVCCNVLQYVAVCCVQKGHVQWVYRTHYRLADGWFIQKQKFIIQPTRFCAVRICEMFLVSKSRGESDLGLCMTSGLAKRMPLCSADFRRFLRPNTFQNRKSALRNGILCASSELMHRPRSNSPLHFNTGKFARKKKC